MAQVTWNEDFPYTCKFLSQKGPLDLGFRDSYVSSFFFLKIFWMWTIFKVLIEFVTILLLFYVLVFWLQGMWDLSSLTRDRTRTSCIGRGSLNRWTTREVPMCPFKKKNQNTKKTPSAPNNPYAKETYFGVACSVSVTWMYPNLLMLSSTEGHTDFFMFLAIMNGGAADIVYQNSCLNGGRAIVGSWGETCLVLGKNCQTVFWSSCICVPSAKRESSYFSSPSSNQFCHFFGVYQF